MKSLIHMLMSKRVAWLRGGVLILPPASRCRCPLYHPRKQERLSSPAADGCASKRLLGEASIFLPSSSEVWSTPFLWLVALSCEDFQAYQKLPNSYFGKAAEAADLISFWPQHPAYMPLLLQPKDAALSTHQAFAGAVP